MRIDKLDKISPAKIISKLKSVLNKTRIPERIDQPAKDCFENTKIILDAIKSKTITRLFSPEFKPSAKYNKIGCRITTVIDRESQKPIETYVAFVQDPKNPLREEWVMMVKDKKGELKLPDGEIYHEIGKLYFFKNPQKQMLMPHFGVATRKGEVLERVDAYMEAYEKEKYQGIGIRLHQLRIERMFQLGYKNSLIVADGNSFLFHKSLGFDITAKPAPLKDRNNILRMLSAMNPYTNKNNLAKHLCYVQNNGIPEINVAATLDSMLTAHYEKSKIALDVSPNMVLSEKAKSEWHNLIAIQPILA